MSSDTFCFMVRNGLSRDQQRQETRDEILAAAARLFAENGYDKTSLDHVAAEAGYTKGAIYSNFQNKEELVLAVWEGRFASSRDDSTVFAELIVSGDFEEARKLMPQGEGLNLLLLELWVHAIHSSDFRGLFAAQMTSQRERVTESVIELCAQREQAAPHRPDDLARIAMACEIGLGMLAAIEPDTPTGLYVDCLAALVGQTPFDPEGSR